MANGKALVTEPSRALLITAFGRFDGGPNCSETLLRSLRGRRRTLASDFQGRIGFALFDVDTQTIEGALSKALRRVGPSHVLLMGQAAGRAALCLERIARNRRDFGAPDVAGRTGRLGPVREGGPAERVANWPGLEGAAAAIEDEGVPAAVSEEAGGHLCNQTLYLALEAAERDGFVTTFLHLPLLPKQVAAGVPAARGDVRPTVSLHDMARAVRAVLRHTRQAA
jgi:pyroglutamyl-peptidase